MENPIESSNAPHAVDDIHVDAADLVPETMSIFHRFQYLPQELRDSVWDAAARSAYEPYNAMTAEDPRLFCMNRKSMSALEPIRIDDRMDSKVAEETLIRGLLALLLASKESNEQSRRTILGCQLRTESLPLLALPGYSYRGIRTSQLVMT
ncbi:hypothetical protein PG996_011495 [Apiospora saccharicola]|uniref:2EXR domain-containing protein n=1 Tax=Apiospora saccharicola TaxID=335842 RepID=A0ABR1UI19_9PEZI